jgi:hypothetical protein
VSENFPEFHKYFFQDMWLIFYESSTVFMKDFFARYFLNVLHDVMVYTRGGQPTAQKEISAVQSSFEK